MGHGVDYRAQFLRALSEVDPDMAVDIAHEDASMSRLDGLGLAVKTLRPAERKLADELARACVRSPDWLHFDRLFS